MDKKTERFIIAAARKIWGWSLHRRMVLQRAQILAKPGVRTFECAGCGDIYYPEEAKPCVDHINGIRYLRDIHGIMDWSTFYQDLFEGDLQVLCDCCHYLKTQVERDEAKKERQEKQDLETPAYKETPVPPMP